MNPKLTATLILLCAAAVPAAAAVTYLSPNVPLDIPDNQAAGVSSSLFVPDAGTIGDLNLGFSVRHTFVGDLTIKLTSPQGTSQLLVNRRGGQVNDFNAITLDDDTTSSPAVRIRDGDAPYTGSFRPASALDVFDGTPAAGAWSLKIADRAGADIGSLIGWRLILNGHQAVASSGGPAPIPDNDANGLTSVLNVADAVTVTDVDVQLDLTHTFVGDLVITLTGPGGTSAVLVNRQGGSGDNFLHTVFDDEAMGPARPIADFGDVVQPDGGSFLPDNPLSLFDGQDMQGVWQLNVADAVGGDQGQLLAWSLTIEPRSGGVPEPGTLALLGLAVAGMAGAGRRKTPRPSERR